MHQIRPQLLKDAGRDLLQETDYRKALGCFATGVTIVTTLDQEGAPVGLTVNSFNSVSLSPALILWSLKRSSGNLQNFLNCKSFCVNVLSEDQADLATQFAASGVEKFDGVRWRNSAGGVPRLNECTAFFDCAMYGHHNGGDHEIFIGEVMEFGSRASRPPLMFVNGEFTSLHS